MQCFVALLGPTPDCARCSPGPSSFQKRVLEYVMNGKGFPDPGTGGRNGNVIYHELVQNVRVTNAAVSLPVSTLSSL